MDVISITAIDNSNFLQFSLISDECLDFFFFLAEHKFSNYT